MGATLRWPSAMRRVLLREEFGVKEAEAEEPFANPYGPIIDLRDKLAGAADHLLTEISGPRSRNR